MIFWATMGCSWTHEINDTTQLSSRRHAATTEEMSIKAVIGKSVYHRLLAEFPDLTRPPTFGRKKIRRTCVVRHTFFEIPATITCRDLWSMGSWLIFAGNVLLVILTEVADKITRALRSPCIWIVCIRIYILSYYVYNTYTVALHRYLYTYT